MLSLNDLHAQIDESLEINSIESSNSYELYTDLINEQRSLWIRNEYNKNRSIDPYILQEITCLELELVNPIDCCIDVPAGCKVLRTVKEIPNTVEFFFTKGLESVGPADIMKPRFILIDYSRVAYVGHGRTTQKSIYAFFYGKHLYITSKASSHLMMKYLSIRGVFEDPTELQGYYNCAGETPCWTSSSAYPLNMWMWAYIKPLVLQQLMQKGINQKDEANNAQDQKSSLGIGGQPSGG